MKTSTKVLVLAGLLAGATGVAMAGPGCGGRHDGMSGDERFSERMVERMAKRLNLSAEQRGAVQATLDQARPQLRATLDKLQANRAALRALSTGGTFDDAQAGKLAQEQGQLVADLTLQRARIGNEIDKLLTDAQRQKRTEMIERHDPGRRG